MIAKVEIYNRIFDLGAEKIFQLFFIIIKFERNTRASSMIEHIPQKSDQLLKRQILILELLLEKASECMRVLDQLPHYRKNSFESAEFCQITKDISLIWMLMNLFQKFLNQVFSEFEISFFSCSNREIKCQIREIIALHQCLKKLSQRKIIVIRLNQLEHLNEKN